MSENTSTAVVTFDPAKFRTWLETTTANGRKNIEVDPYLSSGYDHIDGEAGWLVAATLCGMRDADAGWDLADGVQVRVHVLADAEGGAGDLLVEVLVDGQDLVVDQFGAADLIPIDESLRIPGYEAAILALEVIAARVNDRVTHFRSRTR